MVTGQDDIMEFHNAPDPGPVYSCNRPSLPLKLMIRYFLPAVCRATPCHLKLDVAIHRVHVNHQLILCRTDAVKSRCPESEWESMSSWWRSKPKPGVIDLNAPHWNGTQDNLLNLRTHFHFSHLRPSHMSLCSPSPLLTTCRADKQEIRKNDSSSQNGQRQILHLLAAALLVGSCSCRVPGCLPDTPGTLLHLATGQYVSLKAASSDACSYWATFASTHTSVIIEPGVCFPPGRVLQSPGCAPSPPSAQKYDWSPWSILLVTSCCTRIKVARAVTFSSLSIFSETSMIKIYHKHLQILIHKDMIIMKQAQRSFRLLGLVKPPATDFLRSRNQDLVPGAALPAQHLVGHLFTTDRCLGYVCRAHWLTVL